MNNVLAHGAGVQNPILESTAWAELLTSGLLNALIKAGSVTSHEEVMRLVRARSAKGKKGLERGGLARPAQSRRNLRTLLRSKASQLSTFNEEGDLATCEPLFC